MITLLSTFVLRLRRKNYPDQLILSNYDKHGLDFSNMFLDFLDYRINVHYKSSIDKEGVKKSLYFKKDLRKVDDRTFQGFIYSGISGQRGDVVDDDTGEDLYTMEENHAKIQPTYFFIHIPENRKYGYLILQRNSKYGIKGVLHEAFHNFLDNNKLGYMLEINNFMVSLVFKKMLEKGRVYEMSFIKNEIPNNIEALYDKGEAKRVPGKIVTKVTTKSAFPVKNLLRTLYHTDLKDGMIEIPALYERFDEVDFEMEYNGSKKTFHMREVGRTSPDFNVSEHITFGSDGMPTYSSMEAQCQILLKDMVEYHEGKI